MPNLKEFIEDIVKKEDIEIFFVTELGIFSSLKNKNIKFNLRPFARPRKNSVNKNMDKNQINLIDLHLEIVKKVDKLIEEKERESTNEEVEFITKKQPVVSLKDFIETRQPLKKQFVMPSFNSDLKSSKIFGEFDPSQDLFEVEMPQEIITDLNNLKGFEIIDDAKDDSWIDVRSQAVGNNEPNNWLMGLGRIKVRSKENKKIAKKNGVARTKEELERTRLEIERKKKEIEEKEMIAKEKKEELKKKEKEKLLKQKESEKRKKLELKK
jgi:hypothetical protein